MSTVGTLSVIFSLIPRNFADVEKKLGSLRKVAAGLIGGAALAGITRFAEKTTEAATHLNSLSQAMGMTVEQGQLFGYLAEQSGSDLTQLSVGVTMFERSLSKLANGTATKLVTRNMALLGIHAAEARDAMSGSAGLQRQIMNVAGVVQRSQGTRNQLPVASAFQQAWGQRAGRAAYADLARGPQGIEELFARRRAQGELNKTQVEGLRDLGNEMKNVTGSFTALASITLAKMAPALIKAAKAAETWIAANRGIVSGAFAAAFEAVAIALQLVAGAVQIIIAPFKALRDLIQSARDGSDGAALALIALAAVASSILLPVMIGLTQAAIAWGIAMIPVLAEMIAGFATMAVVVWAAMAPLLPFIALGAALAAAIYLIVRHWDAVKKGIGAAWDALKKFGGDVVTFFGDIWDGFEDALKSVFNYLSNLPIVKSILDAIAWARKGGNGDDSLKFDEKTKRFESGGGILSDSASIVANGAHSFLDNFFGGYVNVPAGAPANAGMLPGLGAPMKNVTIGPTTININGVANATQVPGVMGTVADDLARRQAAASLNVQ